MGLLKNRDAALKAALWVRNNQPVDKYKCRTALTKDTGAVAYRKEKVTAVKTTGIPARRSRRVAPRHLPGDPGPPVRPGEQGQAEDRVRAS